MPADLKSILKIEVPVIVEIAAYPMMMEEILEMSPGSIIELPTCAEDELQILVQNKPIGSGSAVKVGENFGIRINFVGDIRDRIEAMAAGGAEDDADDELDAEALAEQLLASQ